MRNRQLPENGKRRLICQRKDRNKQPRLDFIRKDAKY